MAAAAGHILARLALLATLILAMASYFRFEIVTAGTAGGTAVYRLDRLTGEVSPCVPVNVFRLVCDQAAYSQDVKQ